MTQSRYVDSGRGVDQHEVVGVAGFPVVPVRHYGRWIGTVLLVAVVVLVVRAFAAGDIDWAAVRSYLTMGLIARGMGFTLLMSVLAMLVGVVLGSVIAVMRLAKSPLPQTIAWLYIWLFRGTPVYLQLLLWFNLALVFPTVSLFGVFETRTVNVMTPFLAALLGLGINQGAYLSEVIRGGILAVDHGQTEAAQSLGLNRTQTLRRVVLPQAMRVVVPPMGNEFIGLLKTTSLASAIAYTEILYRAQQIYYVNTLVMELLIVAATWYLAAVTVFSIGQYYVERYYARGSARQLPPTPLQRVRALLGSVQRGMAPTAGGGAE